MPSRIAQHKEPNPYIGHAKCHDCGEPVSVQLNSGGLAYSFCFHVLRIDPRTRRPVQCNAHMRWSRDGTFRSFPEAAKGGRVAPVAAPEPVPIPAPVADPAPAPVKETISDQAAHKSVDTPKPAAAKEPKNGNAGNDNGKSRRAGLGGAWGLLRP